jgi:predicted ATPase
MDFSGDEAYTNMIQVAEDFRLMLQSPEKYLKDLDMDGLTFTGLEVNGTVFVRDAEYASLQNAYKRAVSGSSEVALIYGESGTGKTWLAERLGRFITLDGGVFLSGKFDRLHQTQPFSVLATAFNKYCDILIQEADKEHTKLVASKLEEALGRDACHLVKVIPNLGELIWSRDDSEAEQSCVDPQEKIMYLMCRFVETVTSCSNKVLTMYFDDVQWAPGEVKPSYMKSVVDNFFSI